MTETPTTVPTASRRHWVQSIGIAVAIVSVIGFFIALKALRTVEMDLFLPVVLQENAPWIPEGPVPAGVEARLRGPNWLIARLQAEPPKVTLRLDQAVTGPNRFSVGKALPNLSEAVTIVRLTPDPLVLRLQPAKTRRLPVHVPTTGEPAPGYKISDTRVSPAEVIITGPDSAVSQLIRAETVAVDVSGATQSIQKTVGFDLGEAIRVQSNEKSITVAITITEAVQTKKLTSLPVRTQPIGSSIAVSPTVVSLTISGPAGQLTDPTLVEGISVTVPVEGLKPGVYVRRAEITLPSGILLISAEPELFTVTIAGS